MAKSTEAIGSGNTAKVEPGVCGIVMPISGMDEIYTEEHWLRVRKVIEKAVARSGLKSKLVWDNPAVDVIQSAILQNIYENDVVVCDISNLNPNVMLETGLRLSTKKPTIIVTDGNLKPPFDINVIGYISYQRELEYNATDEFIGRLSDKILEVRNAGLASTYKSFVENFRFQTVTPQTIEVSESQYVIEQLKEIKTNLKQLEMSFRRYRPSAHEAPPADPSEPRTARIEIPEGLLSHQDAMQIFLKAEGFSMKSIRSGDDGHNVTVYIDRNSNNDRVLKNILSLIKSRGLDTSEIRVVFDDGAIGFRNNPLKF